MQKQATVRFIDILKIENKKSLKFFFRDMNDLVLSFFFVEKITLKKSAQSKKVCNMQRMLLS